MVNIMRKNASRLLNHFGSACRLLVCVASLTLLLTTTMSVVGLSPNVNAAACGSGSDADFLGLPPWHRGLTCKDDAVNLTAKPIGQTVVIVALNIVDMALRLLSLVAVGFIIFGGFQYMIARGEPGGVAKGKATVTHAVIGLIIGIASSAIVGFLVSRLGV